jgi:4'-phosphopantetheinyl transferase
MSDATHVIGTTHVYAMQTRFGGLPVEEDELCRQMGVRLLHSIAERRRSLIARCMLHVVLEREWGVPCRDIQLGYGRFGKPLLLGRDAIRFNLSHSGEWVCCAVSESEVGVDIQRMERDYLGISKRFFTQQEHEYIMSAPQAESQADRFYEIWSCKEAYVKAIGVGLTRPLNRFTVTKDETGAYADTDEASRLDWRFYQRRIACEYHLAVCYSTQLLHMETMDYGEVVEWIHHYPLKA